MQPLEPSRRLIMVILAMTVLEVAWALFCATELPQTSTYLVALYAGLILASAVFFVPGITGKGASTPSGGASAETKA